MRNLIIILACLIVVSCKVQQSSQPIPHDCSGFVIDTIFIEGEHIHINEDYLCGWTEDVAMITLESDSEFYMYERPIIFDKGLQTWKIVNEK